VLPTLMMTNEPSSYVNQGYSQGTVKDSLTGPTGSNQELSFLVRANKELLWF